jgi:hypothetical protein
VDVEVRFTIAATDEAARMVRRWYFWPLFVFQNLHGLAVVIAVLAIGAGLFAKGVAGPLDELWQAAVGAIVVAFVIVGFVWLHRRGKREAEEALDAVNPVKLTFTGDGLKLTDKTGASSFTPWSGFDGFREGKSIILLREANATSWRPIPKQTVAPSDGEQIRSSIRSRLPEIR